MDKNPHKGHRQRVKNRVLREGVDSFEDHQILELLLFYCIPMKDTNELAHLLIDRFGSLAGVLDARPEDLCAVTGITENSGILLNLIPSLARRYHQEKLKEKTILDSTTKAGEYARALFTGRLYEVFYVICLDSQNRVNHTALLHEGTINEAPVYPRLIVETALRHQATSIILAHNHPGGSHQPSQADVEVTRKIRTATEAIAITVADHIIVAGDGYFSFAENRLL
ncbi:DNA repair protein RadC [Acetobacterium fimetarium]|uniref:DNA repair protein RadC n=1 Tax=Acetobacterium fimetarium TaxID=52691 RepID=A0ABR6WRN3_9FIRM|nr:DNA repair protein RadC [Acetobacterium fimetarium]MBC3802964.1 DNA repair protein RadC [Acetobacterium fimetarium]